jgi:hypothetical protein
VSEFAVSMSLEIRTRLLGKESWTREGERGGREGKGPSKFPQRPRLSSEDQVRRGDAARMDRESEANSTPERGEARRKHGTARGFRRARSFTHAQQRFDIIIVPIMGESIIAQGREG